MQLLSIKNVCPYPRYCVCVEVLSFLALRTADLTLNSPSPPSSDIRHELRGMVATLLVHIFNFRHLFRISQAIHRLRFSRLKNSSLWPGVVFRWDVFPIVSRFLFRCISFYYWKIFPYRIGFIRASSLSGMAVSFLLVALDGLSHTNRLICNVESNAKFECSAHSNDAGPRRGNARMRFEHGK